MLRRAYVCKPLEFGCELAAKFKHRHPIVKLAIPNRYSPSATSFEKNMPVEKPIGNAVKYFFKLCPSDKVSLSKFLSGQSAVFHKAFYYKKRNLSVLVIAAVIKRLPLFIGYIKPYTHMRSCFDFARILCGQIFFYKPDVVSDRFNRYFHLLCYLCESHKSIGVIQNFKNFGLSFIHIRKTPFSSVSPLYN